MSTPILTTKLYIPPTRSELVSRPRLIERLNAGLRQNQGFGRKLTLISAPAGFGKTTLLSEWTRNFERLIAWVSLDEGDNDLARFWTYVIVALQRVQPGIGAPVLATFHASQLQRPPIETLLTGLINEIAEGTESLILVLDDYHVIETPSIHETMTFLLDHLPPQLHLVIATRADPPLPLSRLRGRGQLTELRTADLRFTPEEVAAFLSHVMGLGLSADDAATLEARTEGWIVGLQMAALSLQGRDDRQVAGFIATFAGAGAHRYVLDYLADEVLLQQTEDVQDFLLQTAILDRLTGSLCDAVRFGVAEPPSISEGTAVRFGKAKSPIGSPPLAGEGAGQEMLEQLEAANLFIVPLDDERCWYRYHHLFADLLRKRLLARQPDLLPVLHRRASEWYEANGLLTDAASHALAAGDVERVARLVEGQALVMMDHGELTTLVRWLDALPEPVIRTRPWLCLAYAWALAYTGRANAAEPLLQDAEKALARHAQADGDFEETDAETRRLAGHIAAVRAFAVGARGDLARAAELARDALDRLPQSDLMARGLATAQLGFALRARGDLQEAAQAMLEAIAISQAAGKGHVAVMVLCTLAALQVMRGQLHQAATSCRDALRLAEEYFGQSAQQLSVAGLAHARLSGVLLEWNDLPAALRHACTGCELGKRWRQVDALLDGHTHLAQVLQAMGDAEGALDEIREARSIVSQLSSPYRVQVAALEARVWLAQGNVTAASRWAIAPESWLGVGPEPGFQYERLFRTLARVLIAQERLEEALELLARLLPVVDDAGALGSVIEVLVLQAMAWQAQGKSDPALAALERALSLAEPEGYVRIFVGEGEPMARLLYQAAARGIAPGYAGQLLAVLSDQPPEHSPTLGSRAGELIEPLSEREIEILQLIAEGLSNREIGRRLFIAPGTVKAHTSHIYGKLGVSSRTQAVTRARALGLLPST